jgi:putative addiction module antidote protein, CC2985 family
MNISFTSKQMKYIEDQVSSGDYQNNSELIRDAIRIHMFYREKMLQELRDEIQQGLDSGTSPLTTDDIVKTVLKK